LTQEQSAAKLTLEEMAELQLIQAGVIRSRRIKGGNHIEKDAVLRETEAAERRRGKAI
jgi:hypothetical protein